MTCKGQRAQLSISWGVGGDALYLKTLYRCIVNMCGHMTVSDRAQHIQELCELKPGAGVGGCPWSRFPSLGKSKGSSPGRETVPLKYTCPGTGWLYPALPQGPPRAVGWVMGCEETTGKLAAPQLDGDCLWLRLRRPGLFCVLKSQVKEICVGRLCLLNSRPRLNDTNRTKAGLQEAASCVAAAG